jgi:hypothetical protein
LSTLHYGAVKSETFWSKKNIPRNHFLSKKSKTQTVYVKYFHMAARVIRIHLKYYFISTKEMQGGEMGTQKLMHCSLINFWLQAVAMNRVQRE